MIFYHFADTLSDIRCFFPLFSVALFSYNDLLWVNGAIDLRVGGRDENKGRVESILTDSPTIEKQNNK